MLSFVDIRDKKSEKSIIKRFCDILVNGINCLRKCKKREGQSSIIETDSSFM